MRHKQKSQYFPYVAIPLVGFLFYASDVHRLNRYKVEALYSFDILIGALITIMVMVALYRYYPLSYKIIRYSTAWIMAVSLLTYVGHIVVAKRSNLNFLTFSNLLFKRIESHGLFC